VCNLEGDLTPASGQRDALPAPVLFSDLFILCSAPSGKNRMQRTLVKPLSLKISLVDSLMDYLRSGLDEKTKMRHR
jgi:hypothetical protein